MRRTTKSKTCVWRWQERFAEAGYAGLLRDKTRRSRIPPLGPEVAARVVALTLDDPPAETTHWTAAMMAAASGISVSSVQRIWRAHGLQPHRMRQIQALDRFIADDQPRPQALHLDRRSRQDHRRRQTRTPSARVDPLEAERDGEMGRAMPLTQGSHIERTSIADQVYDHLREAVLNGDLPQGERVIEARIAKSLGISRAPVREAVNRLIQDGLLEARTHFGASVIQMDAGKIRHLYELRSAIEELAIRKVVERREAVDLEPLRACVAEMRRMARNGDLRRLVEAEVAFHRILCELSGNPYVIKVNGMLTAQMRLALTIDNSNYEDMADAADEHEPILAVIREGDAERAAKLISAHILSSLDKIPLPPAPDL